MSRAWPYKKGFAQGLEALEVNIKIKQKQEVKDIDNAVPAVLSTAASQGSKRSKKSKSSLFTPKESPF